MPNKMIKNMPVNIVIGPLAPLKENINIRRDARLER
jgi:hypothetical protein